MKDLDGILSALSTRRLLIVGDLILDEFAEGRAERICPEGPVPVVIHDRSTYRASGVATAAQPAAGLCAGVDVVTAVGDDEDGRRVVSLLSATGARARAVTVASKTTPHKTRILAQGQLLVRLDRETVHDIAAGDEQALRGEVLAALDTADAVLISDYAKGVCTASVNRMVIRAAVERGLPVVVDPKHADPERYSGATVLTPNAKEMGAFAHRLGCAELPPGESAAKLREVGGFGAVVVTRAEDGMTVVGPRGTTRIPAYSGQVVDVAGAGDAVAATLALCLGAGLPLTTGAVTASLVAGLALRHRDHKRITPEEVRRAATHFGVSGELI